MTFIQTSSSALARTTVRLVWVNVGLFVLLGILALGAAIMSKQAGVSVPVLLLFVVFMALPSWHYVTWLRRVQRGVASEADGTRVRAWLGLYMVGNLLTVLMSGGAALYILFSALNGDRVILDLFQNPSDQYPFPATSLPGALAGAGLLATARNWVLALTVDQGQSHGRSARLEPVVRAAMPWARAAQLTTLLLPLSAAFGAGLSAETWTGSIIVLLLLLPFILILEFSLRFAWATAREGTSARPQSQPLL